MTTKHHPMGGAFVISYGSPETRLHFCLSPQQRNKQFHFVSLGELSPLAGWLARDSFTFLPSAKIAVSLGQALATDLPPAGQIQFFESREQQEPGTPLGFRVLGGSPGTRTLDPRLKRALLYQLS